MAYYGRLKKEGQALDLTLSEFADAYRAGRPYTRPECTLWKDILYGSRRQQFWFADPWMRFCLDMNQGGAMIDLRPYAAKLVRPCGVGTAHIQDASYPFLVQSLYRAGYFTHYAGEGAVKSARFRHGGEEVDLCACRTLASFSEEGDTRVVTLDPVDIEFERFTIGVQSIFRLTEGSGEIEIVRRIVRSTDPAAEVAIDEYITACYGTTEYPEDLTGVRLTLKGKSGSESIEYAYRCREAAVEGVESAEASCPRWTRSSRCARTRRDATGYFREGIAFSPMYTIGIREDRQRHRGAAHMAQGRKGKLNYRCPRCLMREIDMDMLFDADRGEYYCLRCSFVGAGGRGPPPQRPVPREVPRPGHPDHGLLEGRLGPRTEM